jgi:DNA topoisomerase 2-associated protein PAT1
MSFFGFETALPRDRGHQSTAPGFSGSNDAFGGLESGRGNDEEEM